MKCSTPPRPHTSGGRRGGVSRSDDGRLDIRFSAPGVPGTGTNRSSCLPLVGMSPPSLSRSCCQRPSWRESRRFQPAFTRKWFRRRHQPLRSESAARVRPWCCCMASAIRVICGPPGNCFWPRPYRDRPPTCAAWVFRSPGYRLRQEEPGGRHCRRHGCTQGSEADLVNMTSAIWSAMRWLLNIRSGSRAGW